MKFCILFLVVINLLPNTRSTLINHYRENIPRFKHVPTERYEVYLGDEVKLDCQTAPAKIPAFVEWYRNDKLFKYDESDDDRVHRDNIKMTITLKKIDVSDQGLWSCRVHNLYGQISRNFTLEIIDFCDYFFFPNISPLQIPMECVCLWRYNKEAIRPDVDYRAATAQNCAKYASRMINRARKPLTKIPCFGDECDNSTSYYNFDFPFKKKFGDALVKRVTLQKEEGDETVHDSSIKSGVSTEMRRVKSQLGGWSEMTNEQKIARAKHILKLRKINHGTEFLNADDGKYDEDDDDDNDYHPKPVSPDAGLTELNVTAHEPPYFNSHDNVVLFNETHALPAGRTLKLNCRAKGYPEPNITWYKNGEMLDRTSTRVGGYEYKFKRWSMEVEDAVPADSGDYHCDAYNLEGSARKFFNVIVVNRMRRPPIIVPNILGNQSVNVNDTATFHCKVVSDLIPHIMWVRINRVNGSYSYFNNSANEFMFNYTEMDNFDKAHVHHVGDESTLTIFNTTLEDQGIYACLSGNSLGMTMANATLTVNEFMAIHLLTGDEPKPNRFTTSDWVITVLLLILLVAASIFGFSYIFCKETLQKKGFMDDTVGLVARKKRVVVSKRQVTEDDENSNEEQSPYQIKIIETPITKKEAAAKKQRKRMNSENTVLSEYEVETDLLWEIPRDKLTLVYMLGEGAFGEVWKATYKEKDNVEQSVAVKKLKITAHEKELIDLVSEIETFKVIGEHENVLRLVGCCTGSGPLYVVVELCKHGNLRDFLRAHRPKEEKVKKSSQELTDYMEPRKQTEKQDIELIPNLTQRHLVQFAWQVAQGMNFLANKKIVHRDLAARNVLIGEGHILKISDFGLSRDVRCNDYYRKKGHGRLPIKWMALEALDSNVYTIESDVWSYGVLLWEIMTLGGTPYPTIPMPELFGLLKEGYRMEPPHFCPQEVYKLMCSCWREKLEERPSFKTICDYLDWMLTMPTEAIDGSQEFNDHFFSDRSTASGPASPIDSMHRKRKHRPLSAPVNLPCDQQHTICDDDEPNFTIDETSDAGHLYCNDSLLKNHLFLPENSQLFLHKVADDANRNGYVRQDRLVRAVSGVANQSLDSALGSPAWPSYERPSNHKASCLDQSHQYYNTASKIQYLHFTFDDSDAMSRSRDSAIFEEAYHSNYIQSHPLYSKILIKKNMTPRSSLPTKETIV